LLVARVWLVPHDGLFMLLPVFALVALVFGVVNGLVAAHFIGAVGAASSRPSES
jgi:heptaprenyl diphosphate synthase